MDVIEDDGNGLAESVEYMTMEQAMEELPLILNETGMKYICEVMEH